MKSPAKDIRSELKKRILVLDGGLGTMVQAARLTEEDYRGREFEAWPRQLKGCNDILVLTAPRVITDIHEAYLRAGADIITTDTFNANAISLADYRLEEHVYRINQAAARLAREAADRFMRLDAGAEGNLDAGLSGGKPRFVAGSMGPTSKSASISADVADPGAREIDFDTLAAAYYEQARGLADGGVDVFLIETFFDTLNAKAAIFAIGELNRDIPLMISATIADSAGRMLAGQTVEAFYASVAHARPLSIGFNCGFGARQLRPMVERLAAISAFPVSAHPNAGLPNMMGGYDETPEMMAADMEEYLQGGIVNIVGGCCGTTPAYINLLSGMVGRYAPRAIPEMEPRTVLAGLEPLVVSPEINFINIGERCNVAGSARFARMIREGRYEEAVEVAREQVAAGAQVIDICMDDGMIDAVAAMRRFLNLIMAEPEIARVPLVVDSSSWETIEAGLKCVQGRSVVNSISLKEGPEEFLRRARLVRRYGAAAVVMLFDEKGQADTFARKAEVAKRAYGMLTEDGFPPEDIIFDPNVLAIATGIEQHDNYAVDFIEACRYIKENLPYAKVSGGVSNLSFSFRGNNTVREAMHSVFLYHAIRAGMDMGIVNAGMLQVYSEIEPQLLELVEDAVLNRRADAAERLSRYAEELSAAGATAQGFGAQGQGSAAQGQEQAWREAPLAERIGHALLKGVTSHIEEDILEAYKQLGSPLEVIDKMLMPAMGKVGELFGQGKMFLPQVVKSARVMRAAVDVLTPYMQAGAEGQKVAATVLLATVKGDVHDIGKNIVSVVMSCNGYRIVDMGVMVDVEKIVERAAQGDIDIIGLSGLITPSLEEMGRVAEGLQRAGLRKKNGERIPLVIGGATTSEVHTAVKIAPRYDGPVVRSNDASDSVGILNSLLGPASGAYIAAARERQAELRASFEARQQGRRLLPLSEARRNGYHKGADAIVAPHQPGRVVFADYPIAGAAQYIDWSFLLAGWSVAGRWPEVLDSPEKGAQARELVDNAQKLLKTITEEKLLTLNGVVGIYPASRDGDDIVVRDGDRLLRLPQLRNQETTPYLSLADYVSSEGQDYIGAFVVTAGIGLDTLTARLREEGDDYNAIMAKLVADRLTEAFAEAVHSEVRTRLWGFQHGELPVKDVLRGKYQGVRMAFGYPAAPDHSLKREVFDLLHAGETTGARLTENFMIEPGEAICGLIFADRDMRYFSVGRISPEQLSDYARRRALPEELIRKLIAQHT